MEEKYQWNLKDIFKSTEDFENTIKQLQKNLEIVKTYQGELAKSSENLYNCYNAYEKALENYEKIYAYGMLKFHLNMADSGNIKLYKRCEAIGTEFEKTLSFMTPEITEIDTNKLLKVSRYFNFASYSIMAVIIYIVCLVLNSFNNETVRKRTIISSMNYKEHSKQILFASLLYSIIVWILYVLLGIILLGDILLQTRGLIYILNVLIFTITSLTIALLISSLIKNKGAISGVVNVVALGSAFLCGSFIPLEWLPNSVLRISKILPTYYYAITNDKLATIEILNLNSLKPLFFNMLILICYSILFIIINNIALKKKQKIN